VACVGVGVCAGDVVCVCTGRTTLSFHRGADVTGGTGGMSCAPVTFIVTSSLFVAWPM
jgi:hypothetical protein